MKTIAFKECLMSCLWRVGQRVSARLAHELDEFTFFFRCYSNHTLMSYQPYGLVAKGISMDPEHHNGQPCYGCTTLCLL